MPLLAELSMGQEHLLDEGVGMDGTSNMMTAGHLLEDGLVIVRGEIVGEVGTLDGTLITGTAEGVSGRGVRSGILAIRGETRIVRKLWVEVVESEDEEEGGKIAADEGGVVEEDIKLEVHLPKSEVMAVHRQSRGTPRLCR